MATNSILFLILLGLFCSGCSNDTKKETTPSVEPIAKKEAIKTPVENMPVNWEIAPIDSSFDFYSKIKYLVITKKNRDLINNLEMFQNLVGLDLSGQEIEVLPQAISKLTRLEIIIAHNNSLEEIPDWF